MSVQRVCMLILAALLFSSQTACNYKSYFQKSGHDYTSRASNDPKMQQVRSYGSLNSNAMQHNNKYFEYSSVLSKEVASLPGINTAFVFLTDKNAYVGILTDYTATGTKARGGAKTKEQDNTGTVRGVYNIANGSPHWDNRQVATPYNSYFTHKDPSDISSELRQVIGSTLRKSLPRVQEVHISGNREFVNQSLEFAKVAWARKPLSPLIEDFNVLVQYIFGQGVTIPVPLYERNQ